MDIYDKPPLSVYLRHYSKPSLDEYLAHHGIRGQKWGVRNGPPYPLGEKDDSASEKKAGWQKSLDIYQENQQSSSDKGLTVTKGGAKINMPRETGGNYQSRISNEALSISNKIRQVANKTGLNIKTGSMSIDEDCKAVDPDYNPNNPLARNNCGKCSAAYVLRRMGLDVEAEDMRKEEADIGLDYNDFGKYFKGYKPEGIITGNHFTKNGYRDALSKKLLKLCNNENGAMGIMLIGNGYSIGHFVSWENVNGQIHYIDSQGKTPNADYIFQGMASGTLLRGCWVGRLDNLEINTDTIGELVKNK